ncbi:MAG: iron ABC transporter permease [Fervidicoccaceae archaeon]
MEKSLFEYLRDKKRRLFIFLAISFFLLIPVLFMSILVGSSGILPISRWKTTDPIFELRIYRTITAFLSASVLSLNGLILQTILVNPLVDSSILGISSGAMLGTLLGYIVSMEIGMYVAPALSFIFSLFAAGLIYGISKLGGFRILIIALSGVMISTMMTSISYIILLMEPALSRGGIAFVLGSLQFSDEKTVLLSLVSLVIIASYIYLRVGALRKLMIGEDLALSSGINVRNVRKESIVVSSISISLVTLAVGPIGFVGLIIPHVSRIIVGGDPGAVSTLSFLLGPLLLISADVASRIAFMPSELPVGIAMSILGAPFFLFLLVRSMRR